MNGDDLALALVGGASVLIMAVLSIAMFVIIPIAIVRMGVRLIKFMYFR